MIPLRYIPIGNKQNPKNLYYESFLSNFSQKIKKGAQTICRFQDFYHETFNLSVKKDVRLVIKCILLKAV